MELLFQPCFIYPKFRAFHLGFFSRFGSALFPGHFFARLYFCSSHGFCSGPNVLEIVARSKPGFLAIDSSIVFEKFQAKQSEHQSRKKAFSAKHLPECFPKNGPQTPGLSPSKCPESAPKYGPQSAGISKHKVPGFGAPFIPHFSQNVRNRCPKNGSISGQIFRPMFPGMPAVWPEFRP